jgi:hypothetical protein
MVQPREEFLGNITELDKFGEGTITCNSSVMRDVNGILHTARSGAPSGSAAGNGIFWVEDTTPSLPKFTNSAGTTITLGISSVTSVFTRTGAVTAQAGDYNTSQITNSSTLAGTTLTNVLQSLGSDDIANESNNVSGITVSNALDNLFAAIPSTPTLAQVLIAGNETGSNWIEINDTFGIRGQAEGSSFTIRTINTSGTSGDLVIETGQGDTVSGDLTIQTGGSANTSGNLLIQTGSSTDFTGDITILTKEGSQTSGNITVQTSSSGVSAGWILLTTGSNGPLFRPLEMGDGYINIYAANGNSYVEGGEINIQAGSGGAHKGGDLNLRSGGSGAVDAGNININGGGAGGGNSGGVFVTTGNSGAGNAGDFVVTTGDSASGRAGRMLFSLGSGTGNNVSFITIESDPGTVDEKFRFGAYGTLSFFEHADPNGNGIGWLPTPQVGETALFRRHEALVYWDDTNNLYTELTDREMPTA